jgi:hypothetical protein
MAKIIGPQFIPSYLIYLGGYALHIILISLRFKNV